MAAKTPRKMRKKCAICLPPKKGPMLGFAARLEARLAEYEGFPRRGMTRSVKLYVTITTFVSEGLSAMDRTETSAGRMLESMLRNVSKNAASNSELASGGSSDEVKPVIRNGKLIAERKTN